MNTEFKVGAHVYRAGKMDTFAQFHVARRLAPVLAGINDFIAAAMAPGAEITVETILPLANAIAKMSDEDSEYILSRSLAVCERQVEGDRGWAKVWSRQGGAMMFDDISMIEMVQIAFHAIKDNIGPFSPAPARQ